MKNIKLHLHYRKKMSLVLYIISVSRPFLGGIIQTAIMQNVICKEFTCSSIWVTETFWVETLSDLIVLDWTHGAVLQHETESPHTQNIKAAKNISIKLHYITKLLHTWRWEPASLWILQGAVREQQHRCPAGLRAPEALHLDCFLSPEGLHTETSS